MSDITRGTTYTTSIPSAAEAHALVDSAVINKEFITDKTQVTLSSTDVVVLADASDSYALKKGTIATIIDALAGTTGSALFVSGSVGAAHTALGISSFGSTLIDDASAAASRVTLGITSARAYDDYDTYGSIVAVIPLDDTIPQVGEGTEILSAVLVTTGSTNRGRVRVSGVFFTSDPNNACGALFANGSANAIAARFQYSAATSDVREQFFLEHESIVGTVGSVTYSFRLGTQAGSVPVYTNGVSTGREGGGVQKWTMVVEEVVA